MYSIGIDSGSTYTKGVLFDGENIIKKIIVQTGSSPKTTSKEVYKNLVDGIEQSQIKKIVGTGYGRVSMDFIDKKVTEITCHAKGVFFLNPNVRTILDIGGQDIKVINIDENGSVVNFIMNDKCAAGTGKFLEITSNKLDSDIHNIDSLARGAVPENISSMCTVFAESEIVSLLAREVPKKNIAAGIIKSISNKGVSLLNKTEIKEELAFTGGLANIKELVKMLENDLNMNIFVDEDAQIVAALGAAIIGYK